MARPLSIVAGLIAGWSVIQVGSTWIRQSGQYGDPIDSDTIFYILMLTAGITLAVSLYALLVLRKGDVALARKLFMITAVTGVFGYVATLLSIFAIFQSRPRD
jgi:hypothetical protein